MNHTKLDLAYSAGVFDARGCISLQKNARSDFRTLRVKLTVIEKRWAVLEFLHAKFGGCITNASPSNSRTSPKASMPRKEWVICGMKAMEFLKGVSPFIVTGKRKKQIAFLKRRFRGDTYPGSVGYSKRRRKQKLGMEKAWFETVAGVGVL